MKECANIKNTYWSMQEKKLTIEDIRKEIIYKTNVYFTDSFGRINKYSEHNFDDNFFHSENEIKQMIAIQKIRTVAYYLNGCKDVIGENALVSYFDYVDGIHIYEMYYRNNILLKCCFTKHEHAKECLKILGEKVIKESLGIFEE